MIIHENISVDINIKPVCHFSQSVQEQNTVIVVSENIPSFISS